MAHKTGEQDKPILMLSKWSRLK